MIKISKQKKRNKPIYLKGRLYFTYAKWLQKKRVFCITRDRSSQTTVKFVHLPSPEEMECHAQQHNLYWYASIAFQQSFLLKYKWISLNSTSLI